MATIEQTSRFVFPAETVRRLESPGEEATPVTTDAFADLPWKSWSERSRVLTDIADAIDSRLEAMANAGGWENREPVRERLAAHARFLRSEAETRAPEPTQALPRRREAWATVPRSRA